MLKLTVVIAMTCFIIVPAKAEILDQIASVVDREAITCYQVELDKQELAKRLGGEGNLPGRQILLERALEGRIIQILQVHAARKLELKVDAEEVKHAIDDVEAQNNIPAGQIGKVLKAQGIDLKTYRRKLSERLLISKLINIEVRSKLRVSEEAMREYYRKYLKTAKPLRELRLSQVFFSLPPDPTPDAVKETRLRAEKVRQQAINGKDFGKLAALNSDAGDTSQGGDMGWFSTGSLPPSLASISSLPLHHVSQLIRSPSGFNMIYVSEERMSEPEARQDSYDEVHARHILIKLPKRADAKTEEKIRDRAQQVAEELQDATDEDFAKRAQEISQGPSAKKGGDLGWFKHGQMVKVFEDTAFKIQAGKTSGVVESPFGLHIIRVIARRRVDPNSFDAHRDGIQTLLLNAQMQDRMPRWIAGLKAKAVIERRGC